MSLSKSPVATELESGTEDVVPDSLSSSEFLFLTANPQTQRLYQNIFVLLQLIVAWGP